MVRAVADLVTIAEGSAAVVAVGSAAVAAYRHWRKQATRVTLTLEAAEQVERGLLIRVVNNSSFPVTVHEIQVLYRAGRFSRRKPPDVSHLADPRPPKPVSA